MVAAAVVGAMGASASMAASASAGGLPIKEVTYQGLRVSFPGGDKERTMVGGTRIGILVKPHGKQPRSRPSARITVTRTGPGKTKAKTTFRKSLRKGEARFLIVATVGVKYRIRVQIGKRSWFSLLRTVETEAEATPAVPQAACAPSGVLEADVATAVAGGTLPFHLTNTGNAALTYGSGNGWTQLVNGVWSNVLSPGGLGGATTHTINPGETQTGNGAVWPTLTPGTYSMTIVATCGTTSSNGTATFKAIPLQTKPITVTAAAGR